MWQDGIITTDENEVIARPEMTPDELKVTHFAGSGKFWTDPSSPIHQRLSSAQFRLRNLEWESGVYFLANRLVIFVLVLTRSEALRLFGARDQKDYADELQFYKKLVKSNTGQLPPVELSWGTIGADYDSKTMSCSIYFKYLQR
jgi:hypothetical protein